VRQVVFLSVLLFSSLAFAQFGEGHAPNNDIGLTFGGYVAPTNPLNLGAAWALEGSYARRITSVPLLGIYAELPVATSFTSSIPSLSGTNIARSYTSLFVTPGVRLRLAPTFFISPYLAAGVGLGQYNRHLFNGAHATDATFAFDVGGGLDIKVLPYVSLRGEIRDFNSGGLGVQTLIFGRQNNIFGTVGLAVRF
jgi:opacity protein-like surface antigen